MTTLTLVRHGETAWHAENRYAGSSDIALTPRGTLQAQDLAGWAAGAGVDAVWSSDLARARTTAQASAQALGLGLGIDPRLRELDFGQGEGLTAAEMRERFPQARALFEEDPALHPLPGGEDPQHAAARFTQALAAIAAAQDGHVLVVAHTTAIRLALCDLLGIPLGRYRRALPSLGNCSLTTLRMHEGETGLLQYNTPLCQAPPGPRRNSSPQDHRRTAP